jgi:hypothetical protein
MLVNDYHVSNGQEGGDNMRVLTEFKGYIVDCQLEQFRKVIPFNTEEGHELVDEMWLDGELFLQHEAGDRDAWICVCGNKPTEDGFFPCDWEGNQVEPTAQEWPQPLYICERCGRIIDDGFRQFVVSRPEEKARP